MFDDDMPLPVELSSIKAHVSKGWGNLASRPRKPTDLLLGPCEILRYHDATGARLSIRSIRTPVFKGG